MTKGQQKFYGFGLVAVVVGLSTLVGVARATLGDTGLRDQESAQEKFAHDLARDGQFPSEEARDSMIKAQDSVSVTDLTDLDFKLETTP